jgi:hypothetical protein
MQGELLNYALRKAGEQATARWQYQRYLEVISDGFQLAAASAGETCALSFEQLARITLAGVDGLILQCRPGALGGLGDGDRSSRISRRRRRIRVAGSRRGAGVGDATAMS